MRRLRAQGGRALRTREAGVAVRAYYGALPSMAGRGTGMGGKPYPPRPRKHGPRSEIAAVARRKALRGAALSPTAKRIAYLLPPRLSARCHPSCFEGKPQLPSGSSSYGNARAWLFEIHIGPDVARMSAATCGAGLIERLAPHIATLMRATDPLAFSLRLR